VAPGALIPALRAHDARLAAALKECQARGQTLRSVPSPPPPSIHGPGTAERRGGGGQQAWRGSSSQSPWSLSTPRKGGWGWGGGWGALLRPVDGLFFRDRRSDGLLRMLLESHRADEILLSLEDLIAIDSKWIGRRRGASSPSLVSSIVTVFSERSAVPSFILRWPRRCSGVDKGGHPLKWPGGG